MIINVADFLQTICEPRILGLDVGNYEDDESFVNDLQEERTALFQNQTGQILTVYKENNV